MSLTDRFMTAFRGSDLAHGQTTIGNKRRANGKTDAKSFIVKQPLTKDLIEGHLKGCLLYTSPSPRDGLLSRMPSSA